MDRITAAIAATLIAITISAAAGNPPESFVNNGARCCTGVRG